jgi:hypothetical protein
MEANQFWAVDPIIRIQIGYKTNICLNLTLIKGSAKDLNFYGKCIINTRLGVIGMLHFFHQKRKKKECFILIGMRQQGNRTHTHDKLI